MDDVIDDRDLQPGDADLFSHDVIVARVADILSVASGPLNIGVFGAWGTGKTSFLNRLSAELRRRSTFPFSRPRFRVVRYDAWRYGSAALRRDLIAVASRELGVRGPQFSTGLFEGRQTVRIEANDILQRARLFVVGTAKVLAMVGILGAVVGLGWAAIDALIEFQLVSFDLSEVASSWKTILAWITGLAAAANLPTLVGVSVTRSRPSEDDEFSQTLKDLVQLAEVPYLARALVMVPFLGFLVRALWGRRIVFLIDEVDRSSDSDIVATLNALQTMLSTAGVYVVLTADRSVVGKALEGERHQSGPSREFDPYRSGYESYFDKIFQVQFSLPPLRHERVAAFADDLVRDRAGIWRHVRELELLDDVVYALIPGHIDSPRRVKVLLNAFAASCRVVAGRGLPVESMFLDIAQWVVLQNEFPTFAEDCLIDPRLKSRLLGEERTTSPTSGRLLLRHGRKPAPESDAEPPVWVDWNRRELLWQYLEQVAHLQDPPRELLYLEHAGTAVGQFEPEVAAALDAAGDAPPASIVARLAPQNLSSKDLSNAINFLARRARAVRAVPRERLIVVLSVLALQVERGRVESLSTIGPLLRAVDVDQSIAPEVWLAAMRVALLESDATRVRELTSISRFEPDVSEFLTTLGHVEVPNASHDSVRRFASWAWRFFDLDRLIELLEFNRDLGEVALSEASGHLLIWDEWGDKLAATKLRDVIAESSDATQQRVLQNLAAALIESRGPIPLIANYLRGDDRTPWEFRSELAAVVFAEWEPIAAAGDWAPLIRVAPKLVSAQQLIERLWAASHASSARTVCADALARVCVGNEELKLELGEVIREGGWSSKALADNSDRSEAISAVADALGEEMVVLPWLGVDDREQITDIIASGVLEGRHLALVRRAVAPETIKAVDTALRQRTRTANLDERVRLLEARMEMRSELPDGAISRVPTPEVVKIVRAVVDAKRASLATSIVGLHFSTSRTDRDLITYLRATRNATGIPLKEWASQHSALAVSKVWTYMANAGYGPTRVSDLAERCQYDSADVVTYLRESARSTSWRRAVELLPPDLLGRADVELAAYAVSGELATNADIDARKYAVRLASSLDSERLPDWLKTSLNALPQSYFRRVAEKSLGRVLGILGGGAGDR